MVQEEIIGRDFPKPDARAKTTGRALYVGDIARPGMLYGKILRSPHAHARVLAIDVSEAAAMPGVKAVVTSADITGQNRIGMTGAKDQRVLADDKVRFYGEAVAAVAADTKETARAALQRIRVTYEELPVVGSTALALEPGAPHIGEKGNVCIHRKIVKGDWEKGLAEADVVVRGEYRTAPVEHAYLEPEAVLAEPAENGIFLWSSTKSVHLDQREVARVLGWPLERVNAAAAEIGGSFGGKSDLALNSIAALLCVKSGMPVSIVYEREESIQVSTKRHSCTIRYTHGAKKDGTLTAVKLDIVADAGAYSDYTSTVLPRMIIAGAGPYRVPNVFLEVRGVHTNNPVSGAMRGFGQPQVAFACERQMDRLAQALGLDAIELRLKNGLVDGDTSATGQELSGVTVRQLLEIARERMAGDEAGRQGTPPKTYEKDGWGVAAFLYGNGRTGMPNPGVARMGLTTKGLVELCVGTPDIGQGSDTTYSQIAAATIGVTPEYVRVTSADTRCTPDSGTTSGTRNTAIVGKAVQLAAAKLRALLFRNAAAFYSFDESRAEIRRAGGGFVIEAPGHEPLTFARLAQDLGGELAVEEIYDPPVTPLDENGCGNPYAFYTYGVQCARVRVNIYTGKVTVKRIIAVYDVGTVISPILFAGQIEGGVAMGVGYALTEEIKLSRGIVQNNNFDNYVLPTSMDVPDVEIITVPLADQRGPFGAKGVGEPALVPTAAAIANAVAKATGADVWNLPLSLEEVTNVLDRKETER
ncbi:MAG: xanthine dehydrogenase family protein molybdopterin-binding subunit [Syntrophorhabdaceae bacterium]|nr:xanthine dehydrogenase family protein molybdopterin-binding subunit [Syntrophorhabdaceae bacterium]